MPANAQSNHIGNAALAYYYQNKEILDEDIRRVIATAEAYKQQGINSRGASLLPR